MQHAQLGPWNMGSKRVPTHAGPREFRWAVRRATEGRTLDRRDAKSNGDDRHGGLTQCAQMGVAGSGASEEPVARDAVTVHGLGSAAGQTRSGWSSVCGGQQIARWQRTHGWLRAPAAIEDERIADQSMRYQASLPRRDTGKGPNGYQGGKRPPRLRSRRRSRAWRQLRQELTQARGPTIYFASVQPRLARQKSGLVSEVPQPGGLN